MLLVSFKNDSEVHFTAENSNVKTNCHRLRHRLAKNENEVVKKTHYDVNTGLNLNTLNQFRNRFRTSFLQLKRQRNYDVSPFFLDFEFYVGYLLFMFTFFMIGYIKHC